MNNFVKTFITLYIFYTVSITNCDADCTIPFVVRGSWFSFERGSNVITQIDDKQMSNHGTCVAMDNYRHDNLTFLFKDTNCYYCVKFLVRTLNILEKKQSDCLEYPQDYSPSLEEACSKVPSGQTLITFFNENYTPKNCRSALEGVWQFSYQNSFSFTGECNHVEAQIRSCQQPGNQFLIANQKFTINYKKCEGISESFEALTEFSCLGDWFVGKDHFFAVANTKESRKEEMYRCFIRNRDDDIYMGHTITPECGNLKTPENSPARFKMTPVKPDVVQPGCLLPQNFTGEWVNTANREADVVINQTHITETTYPDLGRYRKTIYICREQRDNRYMMARLNIDGCQTDFVCFEFVPRHHNVIRFRKGLEMIREEFSTVCSYVQFKSGIEWNYDLMLAKEPVPVKCPVAGKFNFTQYGELPFETRILGGLTGEPWQNIYCRENISDFSVCDKEQKEIRIDANLCIMVDAYGKHVDIYTEPDFKLKCIGFWKENLKSYLITFDELDPYSKYRCWVYQRADLNKLLLSQSVGPFCNLHQNVHINKNSLGAAISLKLVEYEREHDRCPMHFDDGSDPWKEPGDSVHVFKFTNGATATLGCSFLYCHTTFIISLIITNIYVLFN